MLEHHLAFFISAVGVFNGIMTWIYLQFFYRPRNTVLTLGCMILMMFCIRVGVSCVYFFTPSLSPYFIQLGLSANFHDWAIDAGVRDAPPGNTRCNGCDGSRVGKCPGYHGVWVRVSVRGPFFHLGPPHPVRDS